MREIRDDQIWVLTKLHIVATFAIFAATPNAARSAPSSDDVFRWDAPDQGCPTEVEVIADLESQLKMPLSELQDRDAFLIARARQQADDQWELVLFYLTESGRKERRIQAEDCDALAKQAVLLAALAIKPPVGSLVDPEPISVAETVAEPPMEPAPLPSYQDDAGADSTRPIDVAEPGSVRPRRFLWATRLHAGAAYGDLPTLGPVLRLAFALQWNRARFELEGHHGFRRKVSRDGEHRADVLDVLVMARGCWTPRHRPSRLEFPVCVGVEGGVLLGKARAAIDYSAAGWFALDVVSGIVWSPTRHLAIGLNVEPWASPTPPALVTDEHEELWRGRHFGVRVLAGGEVRF